MAAALAFLLVLNFKKYKYADLTKYLVLLVIINAELTITYEKSPFGLFAEFSICPS